MYTAGSNAVTSYYRPLRMFGAQVRRVLLDNAGRKLGVPLEELTTEPSVVVHAKSGRKLSYGEIAAFAEIPDKAPEVKPEALKKPGEFRLIGKDVRRVELPSKVNGTAHYSIDVQVPDMLYGAILRAPVEGSTPDKIDDAKARTVTGVVTIVRLPYGVGVLAETPWAAFEARRALAAVRHLDQARPRLGLRQRNRNGEIRGRCEEPFQAGHRLEPERRRSDRDAEGCQHGRSRISLRLRLSCADGAVERSSVGRAGWRRGRDLVRHAKPDHRGGSLCQSARYPAQQGEAQRLAHGRRFRSTRQPRCGVHHRRGVAFEGGRAAGQGHVDARGRRPQRSLPSDLGSLSQGGAAIPQASSWRGIIALQRTG